MMGEQGAMKVCKMCGKPMFVSYVDGYVYKKDYYGNSRGMYYFCGWNCMRRWEKQFPEPKLKEWWEE